MKWHESVSNIMGTLAIVAVILGIVYLVGQCYTDLSVISHQEVTP